MRKSLFLSTLFVLSTAAAQAQAPDLNITGAGARAMGMGGAFTAVADDCTAVYYNPAGLAQLKRPELTVVGYYVSDSTSYDSVFPNPNDSASGSLTLAHPALNFAGVVLPLNPGGHNVILAGSGHMVIDFNKEFEVPWGGGRGLKNSKSLGGIYMYSGFAGYELNKYLLVGAGFGMMDGYAQNYETITGSSGAVTNQFNLRQDFSGGPQLTAGLLARLPHNVNLGGVFKSATALKFQQPDYDDATKQQVMMDGEVDIPIITFAGISWRPRDPLTLACDFQSFQWGDSELRLNGVAEEGQGFFTSNQIHLGAEYLLPVWAGHPLPLRFGYYHLPMPSPTFLQGQLQQASSSMSSGGAVYVPNQTTRDCFTGGLGVVTKSLLLDAAVEVSPLDEKINLMDATFSCASTKTTIYLSAICKF